MKIRRGLVECGGLLIMKSTVDPQAVKKESETIILRAGGQICDWLPIIESKSTRPSEEIIGRALILNAMLNIHFNAPVRVIDDWVSRNNLSQHLTAREKELLSRDNDDLTEQETTDLYWYIEALWSLMWVGSLTKDMPFDQPVEDSMASLVPNLQANEDGSKFSQEMRIRTPDEIFKMLDLYFRLHWYARNGKINGDSTDPINLDIVMERRKSLEWVMSPGTNWDSVVLNT